MSEQRLGEADVRAILKLLSESPDVTEFRLTYGNLVIELHNPEGHLPSDEYGSSPVGRVPEAPAPADDRDAAGAAPVATIAPSPTPHAQPSWTIVRAPVAGIFHWNRQYRAPDGLAAGMRLPPQTVIGVVEATDSSRPVAVDVAVIVRAVLVEDGEEVEAGHALAAIVTQPSV